MFSIRIWLFVSLSIASISIICERFNYKNSAVIPDVLKANEYALLKKPSNAKVLTSQGSRAFLSKKRIEMRVN